jgi:hypothetical protein
LPLASLIAHVCGGSIQPHCYSKRPASLIYDFACCFHAFTIDKKKLRATEKMCCNPARHIIIIVHGNGQRPTGDGQMTTITEIVMSASGMTAIYHAEKAILVEAARIIRASDDAGLLAMASGLDGELWGAASMAAAEIRMRDAQRQKPRGRYANFISVAEESA